MFGCKTILGRVHKCHGNICVGVRRCMCMCLGVNVFVCVCMCAGACVRALTHSCTGEK